MEIPIPTELFLIVNIHMLGIFVKFAKTHSEIISHKPESIVVAIYGAFFCILGLWLMIMCFKYDTIRIFRRTHRDSIKH